MYNIQDSHLNKNGSHHSCLILSYNAISVHYLTIPQNKTTVSFDKKNAYVK